MEWAVSLVSALAGMGPFGQGAAAVVVVLLVVFLLRKHRSEDDIKREERAALTLDQVQEDYYAEREQRITADKRAGRYLEALRIWCGFAHEQRHGRLNDRQRFVSYEQKSGIEPLMLPDVPALPRLVEDDE